MTHESLCRSLLRLVDAIPSSVVCHVVATDNPRLIFVADAREAVTTIEMEAVAGRFGVVVASQCFHSRRTDPKPIIGCIVEIPAGSDADETADRLRGAYHLSTDPVSGDDDPETAGPF